MERVLFAPRALPALRPDVSQDSATYNNWVNDRELSRASEQPTTNHPVLGLIMAGSVDSEVAFGRTLASLRVQTSRRWTLTILTPVSELDAVSTRIRAELPRRSRRGVRVIGQPVGTSERDLLVRALAMPCDHNVALIFPGDVWAPDAVALLGAAIDSDGVVYADEDYLDGAGGLKSAHLKPDYSPDFLLSSAYIGRPLVIGSQVGRSVLNLVAPDIPALEHEIALRSCATARIVTHVPEVLCHRSGDSMSPSQQVSHIQDFLNLQADAPKVRAGPWPGTFHVDRVSVDPAKVSVIIPFRDQPRFLRSCTDSIWRTSDDVEAELVLIDNGSTEPETLSLLERIGTRHDVRTAHDDQPFNWARLNNIGAQCASGDVLLFLNNDIEALRTGWLSALAAHALRPEIGSVGARLLYPDGRLQHCGVVVGLTGAAGHPLAGLSEDAIGYLHMATATRECSAVTGACLATRREVFDELGGFDETLGVDLNDVDYCLRAAGAGYRTVYEATAELIHHESPSRGTAGGVGDVVRFVERWRDYIEQGDRYFNPHLTRTDPSCGLAGPDEEDAWNQWYSTVILR